MAARKKKAPNPSPSARAASRRADAARIAKRAVPGTAIRKRGKVVKAAKRIGAKRANAIVKAGRAPRLAFGIAGNKVRRGNPSDKRNQAAFKAGRIGSRGGISTQINSSGRSG